MGLTIHYTIQAELTADLPKLVRRMRTLAERFPFVDVSEIRKHTADFYAFPVDRARATEGQIEDWLDGQKSMQYDQQYFDVGASEGHHFHVKVGAGCEYLRLGLVRFAECQQRYVPPWQSARFRRKDEFDWAKWHKQMGAEPPHRQLLLERLDPGSPAELCYGAFCKTQYAANQQAGGLANFLRCHLAVVTYLESLRELPGIRRVNIRDEGEYAIPEAGETEGTHDVARLTRQVGDYQEMVAAFAGALRDAVGSHVQAPIFGQPDFERLEARGHKNPEVRAACGALKHLAQEISAHVEH